MADPTLASTMQGPIMCGRIGGLGIAAYAGYWVYHDAQNHGSSQPMLWGIGTFLFCICVLPIYLMMRGGMEAKANMASQSSVSSLTSGYSRAGDSNANAQYRDQPAASTEAPRMKFRRCTQCSESMILPDAIKCPNCGTRLEPEVD